MLKSTGGNFHLIIEGKYVLITAGLASYCLRLLSAASITVKTLHQHQGRRGEVGNEFRTGTDPRNSWNNRERADYFRAEQ